MKWVKFKIIKFLCKGEDEMTTNEGITVYGIAYTWEEVYKISGLVAEDFKYDPVGCFGDFLECLEEEAE